MNTKEEMIEWLRDAYAMERGLEVTLEKQSANEEAPPALRSRAAAHLEETRRHAELVQTCLQSLGSDTSTFKTGMAKGMEMAKGMGTAFAKDERVKDVLAAYASEHFEIACYKALQVGAQKLGQTSIVEACASILEDEEEMAEWLYDNLPELVAGYLATGDSPATPAAVTADTEAAAL